VQQNWEGESKMVSGVNLSKVNNRHRPNLLFILTDQMRGMAMGCAGDPNVQTPNLDRLAEEGTIFVRAYANAPVCTPSRATILTGKYPLTTKVVANDLPLPEKERTIGEILRDAGYRTGYIGKWHLDGVPRNKFTPPCPRRHGFEFWAAWNCAHDYFHGKVFRDKPEPVLLTGYEPAAQTDIALDFLRQHDDRPFALFISWGPPHDPYHQVPENFKRLYDPEKLELRPNFREPQGLPLPLSEEDRKVGLRGCIANYYAHITALDEQVGRLMRALDEMGIAENTIVVFTSDHGDMLGSQGMLKKQQPWEESINVPLIIRWKGQVPAGRVSEKLMSLVDLAPTLLSMMGLEVPPDMEGVDLKEYVLGGQGPEIDSVFLMDLVPADEAAMQGLKEWRGVRTKRYTYARFIDGRELLYDNDVDPFQLRNLASEPSAANVKAQLEAELQKWLAKTKDKFLPWRELILELGLASLWNERERELHPKNPQLVAN
jgi:arylsulfatase A-like enzyme